MPVGDDNFGALKLATPPKVCYFGVADFGVADSCVRVAVGAFFWARCLAGLQVALINVALTLISAVASGAEEAALFGNRGCRLPL